MPERRRRYVSSDEDSSRWDDFCFRDGDIVISTRSKSGTTWMQMICALLVFQSPTLPAPLATISPWLDWLVTPLDQVLASLEAQSHRRIIKTHTPLDGLPLDPRATFIVVARNPLDMAVSLFYQGQNLDRARLRQLTGVVDPPERDSAQTLGSWMRDWIVWDGNPVENLDSLPGVMWHLCDAWQRRRDDNVLLVHYDDLVADLSAQMRLLADELGIAIDEDSVRRLATAAGFEAMKRNSENLAPDPVGVLIDRSRFFRRGRSGAGRGALSAAEIAIYEARSRSMIPADCFKWLHR